MWCELGTTWRECMADPTQAAHVLGKLVNRMGPDRVLWGTDGIWLGSPQPQIMAFRTFEITPEFEDRFGYPALTPALKAQIFGLNATTLLGLDPEHRDLHAHGEAGEPWAARGPVTRRQVLGWLARKGASLAPL